ncbi:MAG: M48 family metalloprotease [Magnetococcales bacterium]|nr:M48 family metalloprotease [Magnetococcales bacterium]
MKKYLLLILVLSTLLPVTLQARSGEHAIRLITDPEIRDFLQEMGQPIVKAAGLPKASIRFFVIQDDALNAFALPNRHIVFNSGLLLTSQSRDELAGVMAHEVAHISAGHHQKLKSDSKKAAIQSLITSAAGVAVGVASGNSKITTASIIGGQAGARSSLLNSVRQKELQADRLSVRYLTQAGFAPDGIASFLERIRTRHRLVSLPPPYLLSHPVTGQRIDEARDLASLHKARRLRPQAENRWLARIQAKLRVQVSNDLHGIVSRMERAMLRKKTQSDPLRYGLALGYRYTGRLKQSEKLLDQLLKKSPADPYLLRERALTHLERNQLGKAEKDLRKAAIKKPKQPEVQFLLAKVLSEAGRLDPAARILRRLTAENRENAQALYLLGVVEGQRRQLGPSHLALARHALLQKEKRQARWHYKKAIQHFSSRSRERVIAQSELNDIKQDAPSMLPPLFRQR